MDTEEDVIETTANANNGSQSSNIRGDTVKDLAEKVSIPSSARPTGEQVVWGNEVEFVSDESEVYISTVEVQLKKSGDELELVRRLEMVYRNLIKIATTY